MMIVGIYSDNPEIEKNLSCMLKQNSVCIFNENALPSLSIRGLLDNFKNVSCFFIKLSSKSIDYIASEGIILDFLLLTKNNLSKEDKKILKIIDKTTCVIFPAENNDFISLLSGTKTIAITYGLGQKSTITPSSLMINDKDIKAKISLRRSVNLADREIETCDFDFSCPSYVSIQNVLALSSLLFLTT